MPDAGPKRCHQSTQYAVRTTIPISERSGILALISCSRRFAEGRWPSERCGFSDGTPVSESMTRPSLSGYPASAAAAAAASLSSSCRRKETASNAVVSPSSYRPTSTR
ncbi:hypothetical protein CGL27_01245 [Streptomyces sp. 11-1-2]|nr:hypothetical protein CGL27_01245 [Streptomyces sp. 11-1-2]